MLTIDPMEMPVAEKLKVMESLWDSLCSYYNEAVPYQDIWLDIQRLRHDRNKPT